MPSRTNLQILLEEFAESIPLCITVEVYPEHLAGECTITRALPVDGTNKPHAVVLYSGSHLNLPHEIERIISDPLAAFIAAGWNPEGLKGVEEGPDLSKFPGKKNLKNIGLEDL